MSLDMTGNVTIPVSHVNNGSSDNCNIQSIVLSQTDFDCSHIGSNPITLTVTDENGNTASGNAIITIIDITPPSIVFNHPNYPNLQTATKSSPIADTM